MPAAVRTHERTPSAPTTSFAVDAPSVVERERARRRSTTRATRTRRARRSSTPASRTCAHQRGAQHALLDDPRERALAEVVRAKVSTRAAVAFDAHRLDRRDARPRAAPATRRASRRNAALPGLIAYTRASQVVGVAVRRRSTGGPIGERDRQARARERRPRARGPASPAPAIQRTSPRRASRRLIQRLDHVVLVRVDAKLAGDRQRLLDDVARPTSVLCSSKARAAACA